MFFFFLLKFLMDSFHTVIYTSYFHLLSVNYRIKNWESIPLEAPVDSSLVSKLLHPLIGGPVCFELWALSSERSHSVFVTENWASLWLGHWEPASWVGGEGGGAGWGLWGRSPSDLQALGGPGILAQAVELLVKPQQVPLAEPAASHHAVLHGQLVQVVGLVSQGHLLLLHLPVSDQLLHEHHQLGRHKERERDGSDNYIITTIDK